MVLRPLLRRASKIVRALAWLALFLALPVGAQSSQAARSDSAAVASALHRFLTAFENLDWEPFRDSFSDSATVFHPAANLPKRVTGRGAIDSTFRAVFADVRAHASGGPPFQRLTPADLRIEPLAPGVVLATFELPTPNGSGAIPSSSDAKAPRGGSFISTPPTSRRLLRGNWGLRDT